MDVDVDYRPISIWAGLFSCAVWYGR